MCILFLTTFLSFSYFFGCEDKMLESDQYVFKRVTSNIEGVKLYKFTSLYIRESNACKLAFIANLITERLQSWVHACNPYLMSNMMK